MKPHTPSHRPSTQPSSAVRAVSVSVTVAALAGTMLAFGPTVGAANAAPPTPRAKYVKRNITKHITSRDGFSFDSDVKSVGAVIQGNVHPFWSGMKGYARAMVKVPKECRSVSVHAEISSYIQDFTNVETKIIVQKGRKVLATGLATSAPDGWVDLHVSGKDVRGKKLVIIAANAANPEVSHMRYVKVRVLGNCRSGR